VRIEKLQKEHGVKIHWVHFPLHPETPEDGGQSLEESLNLWERGEQLADICQRWLDDASQRLDAAIAAHDEAAPD